MHCSEDDEREEGNNRAILTVMTTRLDTMSENTAPLLNSTSYGQKNYGMFALDEAT